ncbi:hypothetical protein Zmor_020009 [Zophobas morio]|uniref:Uncharacterized protein n=1 Tax=Zophobas morio TaxID=2755281 RepID=A0AA38M9E6_9CUCU|nr:hypothetical protein Zmor_020009 [Zophobas morio]
MKKSVLLRNKPIRRPGETPMGFSMYGDDDSSSMTRPDGVRYRKVRKRNSQLYSRKTPIFAHLERSMDLNRGMIFGNDHYSVNKSSPASVEKIQTSCAGIILYIIVIG